MESRVIRLDMPLWVFVPRKTMPDRKFIINLNNYRNWQRFVEHTIKDQYKQVVKDRLKLPEGLLGNISIKYTLFKNDKRVCDIANILSIQDKYFSDALVELGYLEDDNYNFLKDIHYCWGGISKDHPRVEIEIVIKQ